MVKTISLRQVSVESLMKRRTILLRATQILPTTLRASFVKQYLTCGKKNCRCARGAKHGPFYYLVQSLGPGRTRKFLLKSKEQRKQARAGIAAHLKLQRTLAELSEINTEILRRGAS